MERLVDWRGCRALTGMPKRQLARLIVVVGLGSAVAGASPTGASHAAPQGEVTLPSGSVLQVEIADTPEKQARGYMYRKHLSNNEGMLFLMDHLDFHSFWMKNCKVSLDIIWLDEKWRVVHLEKNVPPCGQDPCPSYQPMKTSLYVLEAKAGLADREGIRLGDRIIYSPPPPSR